MRSGKRPFTDDVVSIAEDGVDLSFAVREEFEYLRQEFRQALLVLEFELERMVLECELVVKLIYDFNEVPLSPAAKAVCRTRSGLGASAEALSRTVLCVFIAIYSFFCFLAVSCNC
jgi:hypothetical protein